MQPAQSLISRADIDAGRIDLRDAVEPGTAIDGPIHRGEHLAKFVKSYGWSARELARRSAVPHNRVLAILVGKRSLSADTAMRLSRLFGTSAELWLNPQMRYDLELLRSSEAPARSGPSSAPE